MDPKRKKILYLQYTNPAAFPPLENSAWLLAEAGWKVKFIGTHALGIDGIQLPVHANIEVDLDSFCYPGLRQKLHFLRYNFRCLKEAVSGGYSYLYVSDLFSCPIAWFLSSFLKLGVFYHEHDTPDLPRTSFMRFLYWARKKLSCSADLCIFPQAERAQAFSKVFSKARIQICHNMPLKSRVIQNPKKELKKFRLWYHGSLVPTLLPLTVLDALALLPESVELGFAGYEIIGYPDFLKRFFSKAEALGLTSRVVYEGALSRGPLYQKASSSDLGLALFAREFREPMVGASNKPFDYLACGLPILINDSKEWEAFFGKWGFTQSCNPDEPESIAHAIQALLLEPEQIENMRAIGIKKIAEDWNYETQFSPVLTMMESSKEFY